ncbi:MAG TPA: STAS domain-containing protein [Gaiellaceae bacterium]
MNFAVGLDRREECLVVRVEGELDLASAPEFETALSTAESAPHLVIDLSACPFLDSAGMRVIAKAIRRAPRASIVATDPGVLRVFEITSVDTMVSVYASVEEAL